MKDVSLNDLVAVRSAAKVAGTSPETIWNWIEKEKIKPYRIGGRVFLDINEVQAYNQESLRGHNRQAAIARSNKAS